MQTDTDSGGANAQETKVDSPQEAYRKAASEGKHLDIGSMGLGISYKPDLIPANATAENPIPAVQHPDSAHKRVEIPQADPNTPAATTGLTSAQADQAAASPAAQPTAQQGIVGSDPLADAGTSQTGDAGTSSIGGTGRIGGRTVDTSGASGGETV